MNLVQAQVSRLRRLLNPARAAPGPDGLLLWAAAGYRLQAGSGQLDLLDFGLPAACTGRHCSCGMGSRWLMWICCVVIPQWPGSRVGGRRW